MPKRVKENKEEEKKWRKIRKLEKKIEKYKENMAFLDPEATSVLGENSAENIIEQNLDEEVIEQLEEQNFQQEDEGQEDREQQLKDVCGNEPEISTQEDLSLEILKALGEVGQDGDANYGEEINPGIIKIIQNILTDGLTKDQHDNFVKCSKIPSNAKLLDAPKLNSEFMGLLNNASTSRDNLIKDRQQDLGQGTALVCQAVNELTKKEFDKMLVIKNLGDSIRLLANLHHQYTQIRRKLIAPYLDKSLTLNLNDNKKSEFLYSKLEESVKTSTAMKRTMNILKPKNQPKNYHAPRRQIQQARPSFNNTSYKPGPVQQSYKPPRNPPRPPHQVRPSNRRPMSSNQGGRARYP